MLGLYGRVRLLRNNGDQAATFEEHPSALQLRTLATLAEIAVERNSTIVFPLPFELLRLLDQVSRRLDSSSEKSVAPPSAERSSGC